MERERIFELFAGLILVVFLFLLVFLVIGTSVSGKSAGTTISNSYNGNTNSFNSNSYNGNTNSFNSYPTQTRATATAYTRRTQATNTRYTTSTYKKPYIVDRSDYSRRTNVYYYSNEDRYRRYQPRYEYTERYLRYDDAGNFRSYEGIVRNRVDNYEVYVRNREYVGGYFKTTFYFEDYYGRVNSETMTYYIPAGAEKSFVYRDVSPVRYKYRTWWYDVDSLTKVPVRTSSAYYNYNNYN